MSNTIRAALDGFSYSFPTRAAFKTWAIAQAAAATNPPVGAVMFVPGISGGSLGYSYKGSGTDIPDLPGWTWHGFMSLDLSLIHI